MKTLNTSIIMACVGLIAVPALAFNTLSFDGRNSLTWSSSPIEYEIERDFPVSGGMNAIRAAFQVWEEVSCTGVDLRDGGTTSGNALVPRDGHDKVVLTQSGFRSSTGGAVGVTYTEFTGGASRWYISGADIAINAYTSWSTAPGRREMDLQSVVTHEVGHLLGLQHTPIEAATMYFATPSGDTTQRILHADDQAAICYLYPRGTFSCDSNADCPTLESNDTDERGNPLIWGRSTCQSDGTCRISGADPGGPIGTTCAGPADCSSSLCVPQPGGEQNVCTESCNPSSDNCPDAFTCVTFSDDTGSVCMPEGDGTLGDPCEGGLDCSSGLCIGLSETESICSEECNPDVVEPCPGTAACYPTEDPETFYCVTGGDTAFGDHCESNLECEGSLCLGLTETRNACSQFCNPASPEPCPPNAGCWPDESGEEHYCVPGGTGTPGTACESIFDCQNALCVPYDDDDDYRCGEECDFRPGVDSCPDDFRCFPFDSADVCLPSGDSPLGGPCESIFDCESLLCLSDDDVCTELCTSTCPDGYECVEIGDSLGACIDDGGGGGGGDDGPAGGNDVGGGGEDGGGGGGGGDDDDDGPFPGDVGHIDSGRGGGGSSSSGSSSGSVGGCSVASNPDRPTALLLGLIGLLALRRRRS
jgi:MYXO-CTERM domain-containing protein